MYTDVLLNPLWWPCRGKVDITSSSNRIAKAFLEVSLKKKSPGRWNGLEKPNIPGMESFTALYFISIDFLHGCVHVCICCLKCSCLLLSFIYQQQQQQD